MRRFAQLALTLALAACADPGADERAARAKVFTDLSQPDMGVVVGPVVMQSNYAMVDWTRGSFRGGRTLLRKDGGDWTMVLCGGKPLTERPVLEAAGVPEAAADALVSKILREEGRLPPERRAQLDQWAGLQARSGVTCPEPKAE